MRWANNAVLSTTFKDNKQINVFPELRYFHNIGGTYEMFMGCTNLMNVSFAEGVTSIGMRCFYEARNLSYVGLPNSLTKVEGLGFALLDSLKVLEIPKNVTILDNNFVVFSPNVKIKMNCTSVPQLGGTSGIMSSIFYVPDDMIDVYSMASNWASLYNNGQIKTFSEL